MKLFEKIMYPVLIIVVGYLIYQSRTNPEYFANTLAVTGGVVQWLTIWTLLFASVMCFYRASILKPFRGGVFAACSVAFGFIFLVFALDEMSWGQLVYNYATPEIIKVRNSLGEMNLRHLIVWGHELSNIVFTLAIKIIATLYFVILPFFYSRLKQIKSFVNRFSIPLPRYSQTAAYIIAAITMYLIPSAHRSVVFELVFYWILVLMMYNPLNTEVFSRRSLVR